MGSGLRLSAECRWLSMHELQNDLMQTAKIIQQQKKSKQPYLFLVPIVGGWTGLNGPMVTNDRLTSELLNCM